MGFLDTIRRWLGWNSGPAHAFKNNDDLPQPSDHYLMAHTVLRNCALGDPLKYLAVLVSEERDEFLDSLLRAVREKAEIPREKWRLRRDELRVHPQRVGPFPCAVIEFPAPQSLTEVHFTALVLLATPDQLDPSGAAPERLPARYFTLEDGKTLGGDPRTVICEWTAEGSHLNYGDGPPVELGAFIKRLETMLLKR